MTDGTGPTPESNASDIAQLTQAISMLVSQFIRPNAQQANANRETLDRIANLLQRHAEGLLNLELRLDQIEDIARATAQQQQLNAQQQQLNAQQIAQNVESIAAFDTRLEETRQLVAKNASDIAQITVKQDRSAQLIESNAQLIESNAQEVAALAEASHTQLAAIIGNGRRIDRLEQQAS
ncbi:MAG: hypothetical protein AAGN15_18260 [Cyanobacteria bacterium J06581_3]